MGRQVFGRTVRRLALLAGAFSVAVTLGLAASSAEAANSGIVTAQSGRFVLRGAPFHFVGTNAYFMLDAAADGSTAHTVQTMAMAKRLGFTVLRTWAFLDGTGAGVALQPAAGVYNEAAFRKLDYILDQADRSGVRLLLSLVNYWGDYGGMPQYVRWCAPGASVDAFYSNARCRQLYKSYVKHLLTRVNTVNHRVYRDDPTVFAWELANEPRSGDRSGRTIRRWVAEMAAYVRALDRRHMITTGEEGFDITAAGYSSMAAYNNQGWLFNGSSGVAFTANTADPNISFGSIHLYPEYWSLGVTGGSTWITDHIRVARRLGKPLVVGEFGFSNNPAPVFDTWIKAFERNNGAGALVWQIICQACQNYGGFSTIYPPTTAVSYVLGSAAARANRKSLSPLPTTEATQDAPTDD